MCCNVCYAIVASEYVWLWRAAPVLSHENDLGRTALTLTSHSWLQHTPRSDVYSTRIKLRVREKTRSVAK